MRKNNLWNKIFHKRELNEQEAQYKKALVIRDFYPEIMERLKCSDLIMLLYIHKEAWAKGYRNVDLGPSKYFRTNNILEMSPDDVFLGDIYGLWTKTISYWETCRQDLYGSNGFGLDPNLKIYDMICGQYRGILRSNFTKIKEEACSYIMEYEEINN